MCFLLCPSLYPGVFSFALVCSLSVSIIYIYVSRRIRLRKMNIKMDFDEVMLYLVGLYVTLNS